MPVLLISDNPHLGAVVDFGKKKVAFNKTGNNLIDLGSAHLIDELPETGLYRNVNNTTLEEAANSFVQRRNPRWIKKIF